MEKDPVTQQISNLLETYGSVEVENFFQTLFDAAPVGIAIGGSDLRLTRVNPAFCRLMGYSEQELYGKTFYDFTYADDVAKTELVKKNVLNGRFPVNYTKRLIRKDGSVILAKITNSAIFDGRGSLLYSFGIVEDITRQSALEHFRAQLAAIVESSSDAIFSLSLNGKIETWNRGAEEIYGYNALEMVHQSASILLPDTYLALEPYNQALEAAKEGKNVENFDVIQRCKDGRLIPVSLTLSPIKNEFDQVEGVSAIARDMTAQKQTLLALHQSEQRMRKALEHLGHTNKELEQFAFVASHDLQEPLRTIACFLQLLEKRYLGKLDAQADEFIQFAVEGAKRLQMLILDLLHFSQSTRRQSEIRPLLVTEMVDHAISNLKSSIEANHAKVEIASLPPNLRYDAQVGQVFQNLLSNAIKFRAEANPVIHISAKRLDKQWHFQVQDNGIGFDMEFAERIFLIFQRLHLRDKYPGTGVGLAICKKIIEAHGGRIWAEAEVGKGSTFYFSLPFMVEEGDNNPINGFLVQSICG